MIAGTSMGALVGASYAQGQSIEEIEKLVTTLGTKRLNFLFDPSLPKTGLVKGRKIEETLKTVMGTTEFHDLKIPFACVATDVCSDEEVVMDKGAVWEAVRASSSIPVVLVVVEWEGRYLVDGALVNLVPTSVVKNWERILSLR